MSYRAMPTRSTVSYGSLQSARPARYGLNFTDRIALCPTCGTARRIDVNDTLYTHLSGETRTVGRETDWIECLGSSQRALVAAVVEPVAAAVPDELTTSIRLTQRDNLYRIRHLENQIQMHKDHMIRMDEVGMDRQRARIRENQRVIDMMRAENELLRALLAA
jgi:hypothetical protein